MRNPQLHKVKKRLKAIWWRIKKRIYLANPLVDKGLRDYLLCRLYLEDVARRQREKVFFIQIGAHDGVTSDFLHDTIMKHRWKGILVEPTIGLFDTLVENKKGAEGLIFENIAISDNDGSRTFYAIRPDINEKHPFWSDMLGSFDREVILKSKTEIPDIEDYIIEHDVPCLSFTSLLKKHGVKDFDVLLIDVEGYDFQILKQVDLSIYKPKVIIFEHLHLSKNDKFSAIEHVKSAGYRISRTHEDIIARLRTKR